MLAKIRNEMKEIKRDSYLKQLIDSRQNGFIKVVTGIRRCGKSYLLNVLFYNYLLENGVTEDHIIRIDLEDRMNKKLRNPDTMLHFVHDRIKDNDLYYIIIDEVQLMDEFVDVLALGAARRMLFWRPWQRQASLSQTILVMETGLSISM